MILGVLFLMAGIMKFGSKQQVEGFKKYGYPQWFRIVTGIVEVIGAAAVITGIWYPVIATLAGLWLGITMLGAFVTHIRIKDPARMMGTSVVLLLLAVAVSALNWKF